jgi:hypothetical protein
MTPGQRDWDDFDPRSRGGRTTKIHALSDPDCRPCAFYLTPGQDADIAAAPALLELAPPMDALIGDKGYFAVLACTELRRYGADSIQVARRLRTMIENLIRTLPDHRHAALQAQLALLDQAINAIYSLPEDLALGLATTARDHGQAEAHG